mmetsp:Transcript_8002/g.7499  ORF Transcript_8002/g.7499 Transcript_8002/m.7499 type:complete len:132 (+) Transcript_8002:2096-2491(+)
MNITFFAIQILRALIQYSTLAKSKIIEEDDAIDSIVILVKVENLGNINDELENAIYSFFTQLTREESDYKRIIGKKMLPVINERLENAQEHPFSKPGGFTQTEVKFFKLVSVLIKNCKENIFIMKSLKGTF